MKRSGYFFLWGGVGGWDCIIHLIYYLNLLFIQAWLVFKITDKNIKEVEPGFF